MQILRMYTGPDGRSHFEDLTPEQLAEVAKRISGPVMVPTPNSPSNRPAGFFADIHAAPKPMVMVMCTSVSEYEAVEGWRRLYPGDVMVVEDITGEGHKFHVTGQESRIALVAELKLK